MPIAPARCTTEVSTLITRSRLATIAAVSAKSRTSSMTSSRSNPASAPAARSLLQADEPHARDGGERRQGRQARCCAGDPARRTRPARAAPARPSTARRAAHRPPAAARAHCRASAGSAARYGTVARDRLQRGLERARQAVERAMEVERAAPAHRPSGTSRDAGDRAHQPGQRRRHRDDNARATACQQRQVAQELQRIAETFLLHHQHRAPVRSGRRDSGGSNRSAGSMLRPGSARTQSSSCHASANRPACSRVDGAVHPDLPIVRRARQRLVRTRRAPRRIGPRSSASCRDSPRTPAGAGSWAIAVVGTAPPPR